MGNFSEMFYNFSYKFLEINPKDGNLFTIFGIIRICSVFGNKVNPGRRLLTHLFTIKWPCHLLQADLLSEFDGTCVFSYRISVSKPK